MRNTNTLVATIAAAGIIAGVSGSASADTFNLRVASGHAPQTHYVLQMSTYFLPMVKQKLEAMGHKLTYNEAYGGSLVKVAETLEGVQDGIVDIGGYCMCFEPSNLFLNNYPLWVPFDTPTATNGIKATRAVYDAVPHLQNVFEEKYNQKLLSLVGFDNYGLYSKFPWTKVEEIKGRKMSGAGPNLPWVEAVGAIPVGTTLPDVYPSLQTGVYDGVILFPSVGWSHKLYEVAPYYTITGFGAKAFHGVTINKTVWDRFPPAVQKAFEDSARALEAFSGPDLDIVEAQNLGRMVQNGAIIRKISSEEQVTWAKALADLPNERAKEADSKGMPGSQALKEHMKQVADLGIKMPVVYEIK